MPVFSGAGIQRGNGLGSILSGFFSPSRSSIRQEQRQKRVDERRKDGNGGGDRRSGREIVEGVWQETRAGGYKMDGARSEVSVRIRRSTREDQQEEEKDTRRVLVIMALVHEQSCECTKSELDLFSVPPTQTSIKQGSWIEYHPLTTVADGSPIEFDVGASGEDYIDFANTMLYVKAKITRADGTNLAVDSPIGPSNLFLHSLFSQGDVSLNGTLITASTNLSVSRHD